MAVFTPTFSDSAAIDSTPLNALKSLLSGPFEPEDVRAAESAIRALITVPNLHSIPMVDFDRGGYRPDMTDDSDPPIGDHVLDYEFQFEWGKVPVLPKLAQGEISKIEVLMQDAFSRHYGKPFEHLTQKAIFESIPYDRRPPLEISEEFEDTRPDNGFAFNMVMSYGLTLLRYHRAGAIVFSDGLVYKTCEDYLFSKYPAELFTQLDNEWQASLRNITGPGRIGVTVPPLLACVLTRAKSRSDLSTTIRDLREEYASSRVELWNHLHRMWSGASLRDQLRSLEELEGASKNLFRAAFPKRLRLLQTGLSIATKVADMRPLGALEEAGKAALGIDEAWSHVSSIGFLKQLAYDLRRISGMDTLLRRTLTRSEAADFGIT